MSKYTLTQLGNCHIRTGPSLNDAKTGLVQYTGTVWTSDEMVVEGPRNWYKNDKGWVSAGTGHIYMSVITQDTKPAPVEIPDTPPPVASAPPIKLEATVQSSDWLKNPSFLKGINGLPFQFLETTDIPLNAIGDPNITSPYGKMYYKRILTRMPLLMLSPGRPAVLTGSNREEKQNVLSQILSSSLGDNQMNDLLDGIQGRLYTFEFDFADYWNKVNLMLRSICTYLGLGDRTLDGIKLKNYDWAKYSETGFKKFFSTNEVIPFYVEGETQISDSMSNSSKQSSLAGTMDQWSGTAREMQFYMGAAGINVGQTGDTNKDIETLQLAMSKSGLSKIVPEALLNRVADMGITTLVGGKLDFPEIFSDSSYSKEYRVKLKFEAPSGNTMAILLHCIRPLVMIFCMMTPHQLGPNSYGRPNLVRGFLKSVFTVDLGLITGLSWSKGAEGSWNVDHLPTVIDVDVDIKDLYSGLYLPNNIGELLNNTLMLDFIANMCGVDIAKVEIMRKLELWLDDKFNLFRDIPSGLIRNVEEGLSNLFNKYLK